MKNLMTSVMLFFLAMTTSFQLFANGENEINGSPISIKERTIGTYELK
ncbi:MAG: hypothetical protein M3512_08145 [Bacteroidota bacterium]|nr:hypothetical protein [Bacteroidota bacterium]